MSHYNPIPEKLRGPLDRVAWLVLSIVAIYVGFKGATSASELLTMAGYTVVALLGAVDLLGFTGGYGILSYFLDDE